MKEIIFYDIPNKLAFTTNKYKIITKTTRWGYSSFYQAISPKKNKCIRKYSFNIGDIVKTSEGIGVIIEKYVMGGFDWEVHFMPKSRTGCKIDCYKKSELIPLMRNIKIPKYIIDEIIARKI